MYDRHPDCQDGGVKTSCLQFGGRPLDSSICVCLLRARESYIWIGSPLVAEATVRSYVGRQALAGFIFLLVLP
jgi:hypothetical protein